MLRIARSHRILLGIVILLVTTLLDTIVFPAAIASAATKMAVSAGESHVLVLKANGTVWAFGDNANGQLGDGTTTSRTSPVQVTGLKDVVSVSAGSAYSLALKSDGTVWGWGSNQHGTLGEGDTGNYTTPVQLTGLTNVISVSGGRSFATALMSDGKVRAWGNNQIGQLGDGTTTSHAAPALVTGLERVIALSSKNDHSLALTSDGTVWAWGSNQYHQLGTGSSGYQKTPARILNGVASIAAGHWHSLAVQSDGAVWAWGTNGYGQLGDGSVTNRPNPARVSNLTRASSLVPGIIHSFALNADRSLWAWGDNRYGQLMDGTQTGRTTPVRVLANEQVAAVAAGDTYTVVLKADGSIWLVGLDSSVGVDSRGLVQVPDVEAFIVTATATGTTTVDLAYGTGFTAHKFVVKRGTQQLACPETGTDVTCQDRGLTSGTTYTYTIEAYDANHLLIDQRSATVTTSGAAVPNLMATAERNTVPAGAVVTASVKVEQAVDLFAEDVTITYDPELFDFVNVESARTGLKIYRVIQQQGTVRVIVASQGVQNGLNDSAQLLNLTLQAKQTAGKGTIAVSTGLVANSKGEELVPTVGGTDITVIGSDADVNNDGRISLGDLAIAGHHYGMEKSNWTYPKADLDGNDSVNDLDLSSIVEAIFNN